MKTRRKLTQIGGKNAKSDKMRNKLKLNIFILKNLTQIFRRR